jgi:hypothetical protein
MPGSASVTEQSEAPLDPLQVMRRDSSLLPPFEVRMQETRAALQRLQQRIAAQCPGPHEYVQHRVGMPPWCKACGFTDIGLHRTEYGPG